MSLLKVVRPFTQGWWQVVSRRPRAVISPRAFEEQLRLDERVYNIAAHGKISSEMVWRDVVVPTGCTAEELHEAFVLSTWSLRDGDLAEFLVREIRERRR